MKIHLLDRVNLNKLPQGEHPDGQGLWLVVHPGGSRSWKLNYSFPNQGPQKIGLGSLALVPLAVARDEAAKIRLGLRQNPPVDPKKAREAIRAAVPGKDVLTFGEFAKARTAIIITGLKHAHSREAWDITFPKKYAPIADLPLADVETSDIEKLLLPIWVAQPTAARALLDKLARIFSAAIALKKYTGQNPAAWKDNLQHLLPLNKKGGKVKGAQPALDHREIAAFVANDLARHDCQSAYALKFVILTAARTTEVVQAAWSEIDFDQALWSIPGERMKNGLPAIVPLSQPAIDLLTTIRQARLCDTYVFPGLKPGRTMADNNMLTLLHRTMGRKDITVHGFRATFRTWGLEETEHADQMLEFCLHHIKGDNAKKAYLRGTAVERRRVIMRDWAGFVMGKQQPKLRLVA